MIDLPLAACIKSSDKLRASPQRSLQNLSDNMEKMQTNKDTHPHTHIETHTYTQKDNSCSVYLVQLKRISLPE